MDVVRSQEAAAKLYFEQLGKVVGELKGKEVLIVITQIDPDAIGAAMGLKLLLNFVFGKRSSICYCGSIGHPQNRLIFAKYDLGREIIPIEKTQELFSSADIAFVDSSNLKDPRIPKGVSFDPVIVIDHHQNDGALKNSEGRFVWIESVGAACTLVTELFRQSTTGMKLLQEHPQVATLLAMGIYSDTKALCAAGIRDGRAYSTIVELASTEDMNRLINYTFPESLARHLAAAVFNMKRAGPVVVTGVGLVTEDEADDVSTVADFLMRMEGVTLVVSWAIVNDFVRISARSSDASRPLDKFMKAKFGNGAGAKVAPDGHGEGGARIDFPLGFWLTQRTLDNAVAVVAGRIEELVFST